MRLQMIWIPILIFFTSIFIFQSCKKDTNTGSNTEKATVEFRLTDAPGDYDAVWIDVQQISVNTEPGGWATFSLLRPGLYDLMSLRNGLDTLLCSGLLPVGKISQIRLILGNDNSVVVNGVTHDLETPSAQQSGLKFNLHQTLDAGKVYRIWLDFDAGKSIVEKGNGGYSLKPVIRGYSELTNGIIKGVVLPMAAEPVVYAINGVDTVATAIPNLDGNFKLSGLLEGNYQIAIVPGVSGFAAQTFNNVPVSFGVAHDLGIITLVP